MRYKGYEYNAVAVTLQEEVEVVDLSVGNPQLETTKKMLPPDQYRLCPIPNPVIPNDHPWFTVDGVETGLGLPIREWGKIIPDWPY